VQSTASDNAKHFGALDSLRGIAAVVVALFHVQWANYFTRNSFISHGYLMVDFFFVLSGFVISYSYMARITGLLSLGRFMWLRFWRLYPVHILMLLVYLGIELLKYVVQIHLGIVGNEEAFSTDDALSFLLQLFMAHGFFKHSIYSFNNVSWSISLEFYIYVLFALTVLIRRPSFLAAFLVLAAVPVIALFDASPLARCIYGFFVGVITYQCYNILSFKGLTGFTVAPLAMLVLTVLIIIRAGTVAFLLLPPTCAGLILAFVMCPDSLVVKAFNSRWLRQLGLISYSLYMVHPAILWGMNQMLRLRAGRLIHGTGIAAATSPSVGTALVVMFLISMLVIARLMYFLIEEPWRLWSKRSAFFDKAQHAADR